jgi:Malectin domain/IPT/TIG domain
MNRSILYFSLRFFCLVVATWTNVASSVSLSSYPSNTLNDIIYANRQEINDFSSHNGNKKVSSPGIKFIEQDRSHNQRLLQSTSPPIPLPYRINCGQNATVNYTDPSTGKTWLPDRYFVGGNVKNDCAKALQQNVTLPDQLCRTRNGNNYTYSFPVPYQGTYKITLYFVETFFNGVGRRVFNVSAEGINILTTLDIRAVTGGMFIPMARTFTVNVTDGFLTLRYLPSLDRATISAIEIEDGRTPLSTVRINCGSFNPYIDPIRNNTWSADVNFQNGNRFNACPANILNTDIDTVLCSERWFGGGPGFNGTYAIPVLPGVYTVRLFFAEMYFSTVNSRVFNVYVQNQLVRSNFDILAASGGRNMSLIVSSVATASTIDPNIRLTFQNIVQNAKVSGIEIVAYDPNVVTSPTSRPTRMPTQAPTSGFDTILINSGATAPYIDSLAREFLPDQFFTGGMTSSNVVSIANTEDDNLYQYARVGDTFSYEIPVPVGSYAITLLFSENEYNATRQRLFDVLVENELISNVDIFQNAGGNFTATRLQVFQIVDDNFLSIRFTRSVQFPNAGLPTLSGIEVALDQPHVAHAVATGPYFGTVVNPVTNKADVQLVGQTSHTHGEGLSLTNFTWKEGTTVLGTTVNTNYSFGVGLHTISLTIKDNGGNLNSETTTVSINPFGFPAIVSLLPSSGNLTGQYPVIITGTGFNYSTSQMKVMFGTTQYNGTAITIINQTAIRILAPSSVVAQSVSVTVQTPLGTSVASEFNYVGSIPILWQEFKLLDYLQPTVGRFGPDRRLYVGTRYGRILKVTMNSDFTSVINTIVAFVNKVDKETM